ncbi:30S ribosomal protein S11 [bacterium CG2_30_40_12]|nr:MAG: 30S ribosomal protein S11 [bacterium CG2_30_40_12]
MKKQIVKKTNKNKSARVISGSGIANVLATFNNTIITITDMQGNVVCWGSCGNSGFKGARKSTPYAATIASENVGKKALEKGIREVSVYIKGPGMGRIPSVKALKAAGLNILSITDKTATPHNGCRPRKRRRV